jgi:hypothetical protein
MSAITNHSPSIRALAPNDPIPIYQTSPMLPGLSNAVGAPLNMKEAFSALWTSVRIGDSSTRNDAIVRLVSGSFSFTNALISCCQYIFSFLQISTSWGLLALAMSCNITAVCLCVSEGFIETVWLIKDLFFLQDPLFFAKSFRALATSKNPKALSHYIEMIQKTQNSSEKILGKEVVQQFIKHLRDFQRQAQANPNEHLSSQNPLFEKMKREVLFFHFSQFFKANFSLSQEDKQKIDQLQQQIDFLQAHKNSLSSDSSDKKRKLLQILKAHGPNLERRFVGKKLSVAELIDYLVQKQKLIKNHLIVSQISLSKRLRPSIVRELATNLPALLKDFSSKDPLVQKKAVEESSRLLSFLDTQSKKNALLHTIGLTAVIITLIGFCILIPGGPFLPALLLILIGFSIGIGRYIFEKSVLDESGWQCDLGKSIPSWLRGKKKDEKQSEKIPPTAIKV